VPTTPGKTAYSLPEKGKVLPKKLSGSKRLLEPEDSQEGSWTCRHCEHQQPASTTSCEGCGGRLPVIALFTATLNSGTSGEYIHLKWEVFEADSVHLMPGNMILPTKGFLDLKPDWQDTEVFSLLVSNGIGARQISTKVSISPPRIHSFVASDTQIQIGYPMILQWEIENATHIELDQGIGEVSGQSFVEVYPEKPGIVTLTAHNGAGQVRASVELFLSGPEIHHFAASSQFIQLGQPIQLSWDVSNASSIELSPEPGDVSELTHLDMYPEKSTTYTLTVSNASGRISQSIELVLPPPRIRFFGAEDPISTEGRPVELRWEIEHAYEVFIDQGIGEVEAVGTVKVKPQQAKTSFTLSAVGHSGSCSQSFQIWRFPIPLEEQYLFLEDERLELVSSPQISGTLMKANRTPISENLPDLEKLEQQVNEQARNQLHEMRIKRVKELEITDDLMHIEKAKLRVEIRNFLQRVKAKFFSQS
jgi:hypothetical protein